MVSILALSMLVAAPAAFAALTFGALTQTSDGAFTLTAVDDALLTLTSDAAAEDFTVSVTGATDSSLIMASSGTGADAMQITTTAGGLDISVTGTAAGEDLDISAVGATTEMRLASASTENDAIRINASAGGIDIDATTGTLTITNLSTGAADDLTVELTGATDSSLVLASAGTGTDALDVNVTAGGATIDVVTALSIDVTAATSASNISVAANADAEDLTISTTGSEGDLILVTADDFSLTGAAGSILSIGNSTVGLIYYEETEATAGDNTLTAAESGKTLYMGTAGEDQTLPAPADGVWYKFVVSANVATTNMLIQGPAADATDDVIYGSVTVAGVVTLCSAEDTLTFVAETNEAIPGDWVELRSDGTNWYISGQVSTASAFTCTDAD